MGYGRTKPFADNASFLNRGCDRENAGKERMERTAIIGLVSAGASFRVRTSVMKAAVGAIALSMVAIDVRRGGSGMHVCERRRDGTGKLGEHEQRNQRAKKTRYRPKPQHWPFARPCSHWTVSLGKIGIAVNPDAKDIRPGNFFQMWIHFLRAAEFTPAQRKKLLKSEIEKLKQIADALDDNEMKVQRALFSTVPSTLQGGDRPISIYS